MTGLVEKGLTEADLRTIGLMTTALVALYLLRVLFRFLSNYLAHKAAWYLVGDLRTRTYDKLEHMHLGYFHDKQTADQILVIEEGRITERSTHDELVKLGGSYARMNSIQK